MVALGITKQGRKEVLGFWILANESSSGWEGWLKSLRERVVGSPKFFVTDGPQGMLEAISRVFPGALHQRCLVHIGRNMSSGARREDSQGILDGFSEVYSAPDTAEAERRLRLFVEKWAPTYPSFLKYLSEPGLLSFCRFPKPIWRSAYTSNAVEAFHACLKRKLRARLALHSPSYGNYLIATEAKRYNVSGHNRRISGFDDLSPEELEAFGMERQKE